MVLNMLVFIGCHCLFHSSLKSSVLWLAHLGTAGTVSIKERDWTRSFLLSETSFFQSTQDSVCQIHRVLFNKARRLCFKCQLVCHPDHISGHCRHDSATKGSLKYTVSPFDQNLRQYFYSRMHKNTNNFQWNVHTLMTTDLKYYELSI